MGFAGLKGNEKEKPEEIPNTETLRTCCDAEIQKCEKQVSCRHDNENEYKHRTLLAPYK